MKKTLGVLMVFVAVCLAAIGLSDVFLSAGNIERLLLRIGLFSILAIGVSFVIVTGGIDLSIGSVVCLVGCGLPWLLVEQGWSVGLTLTVLFLVVGLIGWGHGMLITKLKLQPFVVTLCGLLVYRGLVRGVTGDRSLGFGSEYESLRQLAQGELAPSLLLGVLAVVLAGVAVYGWMKERRFRAGVVASSVAAGLAVLGAVLLRQSEFGVKFPFVILMVVAGLAGVFLNLTVWGRHLLALGNSEEAARFSGIATDRLVIVSYILCALLAGLGGLLIVLDVGSAQPSDFGNFYELYAIAAAVIGGCSLRGGQGAVIGVVVGMALIQVIRNLIVLVIPKYQNLEFAVIGVVILLGVIGDEVFKRLAEKRRRLT
ncbi:ABC transporter permease [Haloferula rosea]|uniref:ABC transporter permease n=1 Tax=Haloferula rosea TaxID=490093 RepID=A0A934R9K9_9BACT|nr:ABC transporter permease [Haloferula rosea]MBK1825718.1 ABC transporter permease [Haloferula rosea]